MNREGGILKLGSSVFNLTLNQKKQKLWEEKKGQNKSNKNHLVEPSFLVEVQQNYFILVSGK